MPIMTPIRIRGKRGATKDEKWHAGKQRKPSRRPSVPRSVPSSSGRSTPSLADTAARRRRKRGDLALSRLEQLPTEMLQSIFEYSVNVDLPLASPRLASQLASGVLHHQLSSQILQRVFDHPQTNVTSTAIAEAMRVMNSKFFTWTFFQRWLDQEFERLALAEDWREVIGDDVNSPNDAQRREWTWYRLRPSPALPPPAKLLRRPFMADKVSFLKFIMTSFRNEPGNLDSVYCERVQDGLQQAVEDGVGDALNAFFCLGAQVDTELLRKAVIDAGCEKNVVQRLITRTTHLTLDPVDVDFLDPALWAWADKAKRRGDAKGEWLIERLKSAARDAGQGDGVAVVK